MDRLARQHPKTNGLETISVLSTDDVHLNPELDAAIELADVRLFPVRAAPHASIR